MLVSETIIVSKDLGRYSEEEELDKSASPSFYVQQPCLVLEQETKNIEIMT
jgi:hypothetical protein